VGLLPALTRDQIPSDLHALRDEGERALPTFRNLWATMTYSPIVFRHVWGQLLERLAQRVPGAGPRARDQARAGAVTAGLSTSDRGIVTSTSAPMTPSVAGTPTLSLTSP